MALQASARGNKTGDHDAVDVLVERFDSLRGWAELVRQRFVAFDIAPRTSSEPTGVVQTNHVGHLQISRVSSVPQTFTRTPRMASAPDGQVLAVGMVEHGTGSFEQDGRTCTLTQGDFVLYETVRPLTWSFSGDWLLRVYMWPRESVLLSESQSRELTGKKLHRSNGIGRVVGSMLDGLVGTGAGLSPDGAVRLASEIAEMAIIAAGEAGDEGLRREPVAPELRLIQVYIEENLADPTLTPARIAREFYMSTRTLHRLFARHGLAVSAWIKARRLEASRRALASQGWKDVPITVIAERFGFPTQPFFSREFAASYGMSPREYRAHHDTWGVDEATDA